MRRTDHRWGTQRLLWVAAVAAASLSSKPSQTRAATPDEVDAAIAKAVAYLYKSQNDRGHWDSGDAVATGGGAAMVGGSQWGGETALATYALLAAGESPSDPRLAKALAFLRNAQIVGNYAVGLRAQVWLNLPANRDNKAAMARDAKLVLAGMSRNPSNVGLYNYLPPSLGESGSVNLSASQYGVLGAWAAAQMTDDFNREYWQTVETAWRSRQNPDGGWAYTLASNDASSLTMTAAGLATLFITQEFVHADAGLKPSGNIVDPAIDKGIAFVAARMRQEMETGIGHRGYALYGVERVGVASGYKYLDTLDWYKVGADMIVKSQQPNGSWNDGSDGMIPEASFLLLFLSRGRAPVMMNKLQYSTVDARGEIKIGHWNQRPRDAANATHWVSRETERTLNWQIVDLNVGTTADLHDSPILYIAGDENIILPEDGKQKVKQFIEEGGMVVANADGARETFVEAMEKLGTELFPAYKFEDLPGDHPIYAGEAFMAAKWPRMPKVRALTNGTRVLFLVVGDDFGRAWQKKVYKAAERDFEFMSNVFLYSIDKQNPRVKGRTHVIAVDGAVVPTRQVRLARLKYDGNWDPEPGGWRRMAALLNNRDRVGLEIAPVAMTKGSLAGFDVAHLTGTDAFELNNEQREELRAFAKAGGTLIVDAAGGSTTFAAAAEKELTLLYATRPGGYGKDIPASSQLFKPDGKTKLEPKYRNYAIARLVGDPGRFHLKGIEAGAKPVVVFSPEDLSVGLVGQAVDGVHGYTPEVATDIVRSIMLKVAATKPTLAPPPVPVARPAPVTPPPAPPTVPPKAPTGPIW